MKIAIISFAFLAMSLASCDKETIVSTSQLPGEIKNYVSMHFPENKIMQSIQDKDFFSKSYEITLEGNFKLEFNKKNKITDIDGISNLPSTVIPAKISNYVTVNYPNDQITAWELENKNQQIKLTTGQELEFNMKGEFLRIDN